MRPRCPVVLACAPLLLAACIGDVAIARHTQSAGASAAPTAAAAPAVAATRDSVAAPLATSSTEASSRSPSAGPSSDALLPELAVPIPIEDPTGKSLAAFHAALARAQAGGGQARILFYGASHVASEVFTGVIRERLQARFGDAGAGFVLPAKPWRWHRHTRVDYERSSGLTAVRIKARSPRDGIYGLAGVAFDASPARASRTNMRIAVGPGTPEVTARIDLFYLEQPNGGRLALFLDGERMQTLETGAALSRAAYATFETSDGHHHVELRTHGDGPVRIFGVVAERNLPGVVLDTLGIPGARARYHLHWDETVHREHLARRMPDLVVMAYGTNESGDDDVPIEDEEARIDATVRRIREAVPAASCLLVGPSDRPLANPDGGYEPRIRTELLIDAQRRVAATHGCGYFDLVEFMGGPLSMLRWTAAADPLGNPDLVHFTHRGYELFGAALYDALVSGYAPGAPQTPRAVP